VNKVTRLRSKEERMREASDWVARLDRDLTAAEHHELETWLDEDTGNRESLLFMLEVWDKTDSLSRLAALFPKPVRRRDRIRPLAFGALAVAAAAAALGLWLYSTPTGTPTAGSETTLTAGPVVKQLETPIGARQTHTLPDGSTIDLNTNSLVEVDFTPEHRRLVLHRGEATFTVAHDIDRTFSVVAGDRVFEAVGTEFNLEMTADLQIELVVTDGEVLVAAVTEVTGTSPVVPALSGTPLRVTAGQELTVGGGVEEVKSIDLTDIRVRLSWRQDNLVFRGETLEAALTEIRRYTTVEFILLDDDLRSEPVGGMFKIGDIDGTLKSLEDNFGVNYQLVDGNKVLLSRR